MCRATNLEHSASKVLPRSAFTVMVKVISFALRTIAPAHVD
jgi:hypothetical protein